MNRAYRNTEPICSDRMVCAAIKVMAPQEDGGTGGGGDGACLCLVMLSYCLWREGFVLTPS